MPMPKPEKRPKDAILLALKLGVSNLYVNRTDQPPSGKLYAEALRAIGDQRSTRQANRYSKRILHGSLDQFQRMERQSKTFLGHDPWPYRLELQEIRPIQSSHEPRWP